MKNDKLDVEEQLHDLGVPLGEKLLELAVYRDKAIPNNNKICEYGRRETKVVNMLHFINNNIWKILFNRPADGIEQSNDDINEYRIVDANPVTNTFISSGQEDKGEGPNNFGPNCANFLAGIIEGVLNASLMYCKCTAHFVPEELEDDGVPT